MNLRTFDKYDQINFDFEDATPIFANVGLSLEKNNTFIVIDSLLTSNECDQIVSKTKNQYQDLKMEYLPSQRDCGRLLNMNYSMAEIIYDRIRGVIEEEHQKKNLKPFGFGVDGEWKPIGINPCFRHSVYHAPSVGFIPHRDSCYIENKDKRSILTIIIYLNDNFVGGDTVFLKAKSERKIGQIVREELIDGQEEIYRYRPKKGSAIIFNHDAIHTGEAVKEGQKYIIRSDILFDRMEESCFDDWKDDPYFLEAIEYYREAGIQEMKGNVELAAELYERGLALRQFH